MGERDAATGSQARDNQATDDQVMDRQVGHDVSGVRPTMTGGDVGSVVILLWCGAMALAVAIPAPVDIRAPLVVAFACVAPGWALVRHLRLASLLMEIVASAALSVAVLTLGSYLMVVTGNWAPYLLWEALTLLTAVDVSAVLLFSALGQAPEKARPSGRDDAGQL